MAGQQGCADALYDVNENGKVENIRIVESWPGDAFDAAVIAALSKWEFNPPVDQFGVPGAVKDISFSVTFFITGN